MKILILSILFSGCGSFETIATAVTNRLTYKCSRQGVEYVQSNSGLAISLDREGLPVKCKD